MKLLVRWKSKGLSFLFYAVVIRGKLSPTTTQMFDILEPIRLEINGTKAWELQIFEDEKKVAKIAHHSTRIQFIV